MLYYTKITAFFFFFAVGKYCGLFARCNLGINAFYEVLYVLENRLGCLVA